MEIIFFLFIQLFLQQQYRQKYRSKGISTPLTALMCFLVQRGADIKLANKKKLTPLNYLKEDSVREVLEEIARNRQRYEHNCFVSFMHCNDILGVKKKTFAIFHL